ncbi:MAG: DUF4388 domain-containing protein [Thermodesulfobacteriota bacterium]
MMHKILFVDMDTSTLNAFSGMLKAHPDKFEILTVGNAREVPNVVSGMKISMILIDLKMPDVDDLEFLGYMSKNYPKIPMIVMTAFGAPDIEEKIRSFGTCRYYEKPVDIDQLMEKILEELDTAVGGQIHGIGLSSFLQMSEMEKTTCKLKIRFGDQVGFLYLHKGQLVDAQLGAKEGQEAAFEIISWENTAIEIEKSGGKRKKTITMPLMNILMEGLRIKDEREALKKKAEKEATKTASAARKKTVEAALEMEAAGQAAKPTSAQPPKPVAEPKAEAPAEKPDLREDKGKADGTAALKRKRNIRTVMAVACGVIVILSVAGVVIYKKIIQPQIMERDYRKLLVEVGKQVTLEEKELLLQTYVDVHDQSPYAPEIRNKIAEIRNLFQERDFEEAVAKVEKLPLDKDYKTLASATYQSYLDKYPRGSHAAEIRQRLDAVTAMMEEHEFKALSEIPADRLEQRIKAYQAYLKDYPQGKHRGEVNQLIKAAGRSYYEVLKKASEDCAQKKQWAVCIKRIDAFLATFPHQDGMKEILALKTELRGDQVMSALKTKAEKTGPDPARARSVYLEYLTANPDTPLTPRIQAEIGNLEKKIKEDNIWKEMQRYSQDRKIDIFERIARFGAYMDDKASIRYRREAAGIFKVLEKEKQQEVARRKLKAEEKKREASRQLALEKERVRIRKATDRMTAELAKSAGRYTVNGDGTVTDTKTGLMWQLLDSNTVLRECLDYEEAKAYVNHLDTGGYQDWRLPNTNDLLVMLNNPPYFPDSAIEWYWTSESYWKGFHTMVKIVRQAKKNSWQREEIEMDRCGVVRAVRP